MATNYVKGRIYKLDVNSLQADPQQPRKYVDPAALGELAASIQKHGILEPVLFRRDEAGNLFLVAGERRVAAARQGGLTTIPGLYVEGKHREISLVENILRENLTPVEEAEGMKALMIEEKYNQNQLAEMLGKTQSSVSKTLTITSLPTDILDQARVNPNIPKTVLLEAAGAKTEKGMRTIFARYLAREAKKDASATTPSKSRASGKAALVNRIVALEGGLTGVQTDKWSAEDRQSLVTALQDLRQAAKNLLHDLGIEVDAV